MPRVFHKALPENFDQDDMRKFIDKLEISLIDMHHAISDTYFLANVASA